MANLGARLLKASLCAGVAVFVLSGVAHANTTPLPGSNDAIDFYLDYSPPSLIENKIFLEKGTGNTVFGNVGSPTGSPIVNFSSKHDLKATKGFRNGDITGVRRDGDRDDRRSSVFHTLKITVPNFTFEDLMFNVDLLENKHDKADLTIKVFGENNVLLDTLKWKGDPDKWGKDFLSFLLLDKLGSTITSVVLYSRIGFEEIGNFRISGLVDPPATPLPAAIWLFGTVIAGAAGLSKWRKRRIGVVAV